MLITLIFGLPWHRFESSRFKWIFLGLTAGKTSRLIWMQADGNVERIWLGCLIRKYGVWGLGLQALTLWRRYVQVAELSQMDSQRFVPQRLTLRQTEGTGWAVRPLPATRRYSAAPLSQLACDSAQEWDTVWWFRTASAPHDTLTRSARRGGKRRKTVMRHMMNVGQEGHSQTES